MRLKITCLLSVLAAVFLAAIATAQNPSNHGPSGDKLIGAWRLVPLESPGPDGKVNRITDCKGQLIYTRDGRMSVQLMYPPAQSSLSNDYVLNGYEASFGSYDVGEAAHTVTHHVQASVTRGLVGNDLTRAFQLSNGDLIIKSIRADEHWSVTWGHD